MKELSKKLLGTHEFPQSTGAIDDTHVEIAELNKHYSDYIYILKKENVPGQSLVLPLSFERRVCISEPLSYKISVLKNFAKFTEKNL